MKRQLLRLMIMVGLLVVPVAAASAQTPEASLEPHEAFSPGIGTPATFFDDRGNPVINFQVTNVEHDWQEYDEFSAPERGKVYVKVDLAFTNLSNRVELVNPFSLMLIDSTGLPTSSGYYGEADGLMNAEASIEPGETVEGSMVFQVYVESSAMMLMWQPDYQMFVFVYLGED